MKRRTKTLKLTSVRDKPGLQSHNWLFAIDIYEEYHRFVDTVINWRFLQYWHNIYILVLNERYDDLRHTVKED